MVVMFESSGWPKDCRGYVMNEKTYRIYEYTQENENFGERKLL